MESGDKFDSLTSHQVLDLFFKLLVVEASTKKTKILEEKDSHWICACPEGRIHHFSVKLCLGCLTFVDFRKLNRFVKEEML